MPCHDPIGPKPPTKFLKKILNLNYTTPLVITGFEQLSSSICCYGVMAGQSLPWKGKLCLFWKVFNKAKNWVFDP